MTSILERVTHNLERVTVSARSPKLNIKCLLFSIFLGKSILEKICLEQFQKVDVSTLPRSDWCSGGQNKTKFEVCLSFCDLVQGEWPIPIEYHLSKADFPFNFCGVRPNFPKIDKKQHRFLAKLSTSIRKSFFEFRRQMKIELVYLSRALNTTVGLCNL